MSTTTCPRCSECMGCEHHWIADPTPERGLIECSKAVRLMAKAADLDLKEKAR